MKKRSLLSYFIQTYNKKEESDPVLINAINQHFELLGKEAEDKITKFKGVVASLSFDLYGCGICKYII